MVLRLPALLRRAAALPMLLLAGPVRAEVCDKERPGWTPGVMDHADRLASLRDVFMSAPGIVLSALFVLALFVERRWLRLGAAALSALMAAVLAGGLWHPDPVTSFAIMEGCVATPLYAAGVFVLMATGLLWTARKAPVGVAG